MWFNIFIPFKDCLIIGIFETILLTIFTSIILIKASIYYQKTILNKENIIKIFLIYILWAFIQQLIMVILFKSLLLFLPQNLAVIITAYLFSMVLHYPNSLLMNATLGLEMINLIMFLQFNNIYSLVLTHATLATILYIFYPAEFTKSFKVLFNFFNQFKEIQ